MRRNSRHLLSGMTLACIIHIHSRRNIAMSLFDDITKATEHDYNKFILDNPLLNTVMQGVMTREHYIAYLRETFHLVRHTSRALSLAGARLTDDKRDLRNWFFEQVNEENGHDLFCIK